jgi:hypothetical protein
MTRTPDSDLAAANAFIRRDVIPVQDGCMCVDGRYAVAGENAGRLARPGADFGYVMILLGLRHDGAIDLTPEQCAQRVYDHVTRGYGVFRIHTDAQSEEQKRPTERPDASIVGCGHIRVACLAENSQLFGLDSGDVADAFSHIELLRREGRVEAEVLRGDHAELGVLINTGVRNTLYHSNGGEQYFVYDKARDMERLKELAAALNIDFDAAVAISEKQTNATLQIQAKGMPIILVNADDGGFTAAGSLTGYA